MRVRRSVAAILVLSTATVIWTAGPLGPGIAQAKERGYYTRKKVNGRWVTGRFPAGAASRSEPRAVATGGAGPLPPERPAGRGAPGREREDASVVSFAPGARDRDVSTASLSPAPDERAERAHLLQTALEARARAARGTAPPAGLELAGARLDLPAAPPPPTGLQPALVTLDYRAGTRTTVFEDGTTVSAPLTRP